MNRTVQTQTNDITPEILLEALIKGVRIVDANHNPDQILNHLKKCLEIGARQLDINPAEVGKMFRKTKNKKQKTEEKKTMNANSFNATIRNYYLHFCALDDLIADIWAIRDAKTVENIAEMIVRVIPHDIARVGESTISVSKFPGRNYMLCSLRHREYLVNELKRAIMDIPHCCGPRPWIFAGPTAALLHLMRHKKSPFTEGSDGHKWVVLAEEYLQQGLEDPCWQCDEEWQKQTIAAAPELFC